MYKIVRVDGDLRKILENRNSAKSRKLRMMNYPEPRPLKRMPMAHIVTVTGKSHLKTKMPSNIFPEVDKSIRTFRVTLGSDDVCAIQASSSNSKVYQFWLFYVSPIRKLSIVVPTARPGKTKFGVNLSFAAKFGRTVKASKR